MSIDQICTELETHKRWICKVSKHHEDIFQDGVVALLSQDKNKIIDLHQRGKLNAYFRKIIKNILSAEYRKKKIEVVLTNEFDYIASCSYSLPKSESEIKEIIINSIGGYWYDRIIFSLYLEKESIRRVSKKTGIPFQSIAKTIEKCKNNLLNDYVTR